MYAIPEVSKYEQGSERNSSRRLYHPRIHFDNEWRMSFWEEY